MNYYNLLSILTWFYHISEYRWDQLKYPWVLIRAACFSLGTRYILLYLPTHQNTFFVGLLPHSHNNQELPGLLLEDPLEYREQSLIKQSELRNWKIAIKRILQVDQDGNAKELTLVAGVINVFQYKTIIHLSRFMTSLTFNIELQWKGRICQLHSSKSWLNLQHSNSLTRSHSLRYDAHRAPCCPITANWSVNKFNVPPNIVKTQINKLWTSISSPDMNRYETVNTFLIDSLSNGKKNKVKTYFS